MSITINNTTVNSRLTIIFDADIHPDNNVYYRDGSGDYQLNNDAGPASGTGNTESDVYIDNKVYYNIRSHTEIPSDVHALQCRNKNGTWSFELEYTNNDPNYVYDSQSDLPQWVTNVVIRCEAQDKWDTKFNAENNPDYDAIANTHTTNDTFKAEIKRIHDAAVTKADADRDAYLSGHSITY
jgi:hypothetical protein